jgi:hypothetical protein
MIIGLIVGGILVGHNLINAAAVRAQISQIEKFQTATNTFYGKYGYLPGDINAAAAAQFGFAARGPYAGQGDGNEIIEGSANSPGYNAGAYEFAGETVMFWVDLSTAGLIEGGFNTASSTTNPASDVTATSTPAVSAYFPAAKIGGGNFVYVYSGGTFSGGGGGNTWVATGVNYYGLTAVTLLKASYHGMISSQPGVTVAQALAVDSKVDDGLPQSGNVTAVYPVLSGGLLAFIPAPNAVSASSSTCYDTTSNQYSVTQNGGAGVNCALSFRFQ